MLKGNIPNGGTEGPLECLVKHVRAQTEVGNNDIELTLTQVFLPPPLWDPHTMCLNIYNYKMN